MADLVVSIVAGPADRNSGRPRSVDVLACLYVGGSGVWEFTAVGRGGDDRRMRIRAHGDPVVAVLAGIAAVGNLPGGAEAADRVLGQWRELDVEATDAILSDVAQHARDVNVAALVTTMSDGEDLLPEGLRTAGWSVFAATADSSRSRSQWDRE